MKFNGRPLWVRLIPMDEDIRKLRGENPASEPAAKLKESDPAEVARLAGAAWEPSKAGEGTIALPVLNGQVLVSFPSIELTPIDMTGSFTINLLSLLYLAGTNGAPLQGKWVAYRELPGGRFYEPVVKREVENPVASRFGDDPEGFMEACASVGGRPEEMGDFSCSFALFPKVSIVFVLWRQDEEFPASVGTLYDAGSPNHLGAFELRMGAQDIASRLLKWRKTP